MSRDSHPSSRWAWAFAERGVLHRFPSGAVLYTQGDPADSLLLIVQGAAKLVMTDADGHETVLGVRTPEELMGLECISGTTRRQATAISIDALEAWRLNDDVVAQYLTEEPALYTEIVRSLARTNEDLAAKLADQVLPVDDRLARLLARQAAQLGTPRSGGIVLPRTTQRELASAIRASQRGVERALHRLRHQGLINLGYRQITILDPDGLRRRAGVVEPAAQLVRSASTERVDVSKKPETSGLPPAQPALLASSVRHGAPDHVPHSPERPQRHRNGAEDTGNGTEGGTEIRKAGDNARADSSCFVVVGATTHHLVAGEPFTFGRDSACTVSLGEEDTGIPRRSGSVQLDEGLLWLTNNSAIKTLAIVDEFGFRAVLAPGRRMVVEGRIRVLIDGAAGRHELVLHGPEPATAMDAPADNDTMDSFGQSALISAADRLALVALFSGYLREGPQYDPHPKSYAAAAKRLGWPRTTLVKRIEYLRTRLANAGVPNLTGWNAIQNLAEYVLTRGLISRDDLHLIDR